jgi:toxin YoeB
MNRKLVWTDEAWADYISWQTQDRKTLRRINRLIEDIKRNPYEGIGKPEALRENLSGFWSRRIDQTHRIVYTFDDETITIISCRYHY